MNRTICISLFAFASLSVPFTYTCSALTGAAPVTTPGPTTPCPRYTPGGELVAPLDLFSSHGILRVTLIYQTRLAPDGNVLYCLTTPEGVQSPTLHINPGDELLITLKNALPPSTQSSFRKGTMAHMNMSSPPDMSIIAEGLKNCGNMVMTDTSVNLHYHGANVPPRCHQDEVIKTLVNSGETFEYDVHFPLDEPPGLYWYHPHIHGISEPAVQGGASGAIIVDGIETINHDVSGMPERTLIVRDNLVPTGNDPDGDGPAWDLSLNYTPIAFPNYPPVRIPMKLGGKELWRVLNAAADTILDLQLRYDGVPQDLQIIAIDGVPTGSMDGTSEGKTLLRKHFKLAPASRVEFIVVAPKTTVKKALLYTLSVDTGPFGDNDPERPLAFISATTTTADGTQKLPKVTTGPVSVLRFSGLAKARPVTQRKLYFSEILSDPTDPASPTNFFITVDGDTPKLFDPSNPPAIVTKRGAVEDWTIENRALENHEFHIHQIHFLVTERNGKPVNGQYRDMIDVPYWTGSGPYPSVKLRMDFRGPVVGDFVYHCHILGHEDSGMMAVIRVLP